MNSRQKANQLIVGLLAEAVAKYPDLRFGQILTSMAVLNKEEHDTPDGVFHTIKDPFYEESIATLSRIVEKGVK
jgi:hypothetical protein